jgi:hypothetical protein
MKKQINKAVGVLTTEYGDRQWQQIRTTDGDENWTTPYDETGGMGDR